ncbi:oxidoreductase [Irpex rosettiformis]|uniref:Oxidoreductase n=1 Tax=Irpex rosettiformis TaxID=378272 RepID=A0ACB8U2V5_9APHY|nr:oxidoreductase [Irpex rosettiformis]
MSSTIAKPWSSYMLDIYVTRKGPALGTLYMHELEEKAREKLKDLPGAFLYVAGSAGNGSADTANRVELDKWKIIPRMLRDATKRDLNTTLFGVDHRSPIIVAPVGVQGIVHPDAEIASTRAAAKLGVTYCTSTAATRTIEQIAEANGDGHRWYQLYWPVDKDITVSLLNRAKASGYSALVITLDTMLLGFRPHDLATAYLPFMHSVGSQIGLSDPVFMAKYGKQPVTDIPEYPYDPLKFEKLLAEGDEKTKELIYLAAEWIKQVNSGTFRSWEQLKHVRDNWEGPLILKGILSVEDAETALEHRVDGIVVSNHGGRQVEGSIPAIWALDKICASPKIKEAQASGKLTVLFDSGIRTGSDIVKAIALGAQGVLLARPFMYGLTVGGEEGVEEVLRMILADTEITLGLSGYTSLKEIMGQREKIVVKIA